MTEFIYGINPAIEILKTLNKKSRDVKRGYLINSPNNKRLKNIENKLRENKIPFVYVDKGYLFQLSNSKNHQGIVLETSEYRYTKFTEVVNYNRLILLDNIEDPHNLGAVLRSAESFGFKMTLLPIRGTPKILPSVVKSSAGATEYLKICRQFDANGYVKRLKDLGYSIIVLDAKGKFCVEEIRERALEKILIVIGGEDKGVGQYIINVADFVVKLKTVGKINSLNASVAAGISLYLLK